MLVVGVGECGGGVIGGGVLIEIKSRGRFRSRLSQTGSKPTTIFGFAMVEVVARVLVDAVEVLVVGVGEGVVVVLVVVVCWCWVWGRRGGGLVLVVEWTTAIRSQISW